MTTSFGNKILVIGDHKYYNTRSRSDKHDDKKLTWRCSYYHKNGCKVHVHTYRNAVLGIFGQHIHYPYLEREYKYC